MKPPIRVVVVEDSPTQRAFLRRSLEADGDIIVVGEAATAASAVAAVAHGLPDVITMDLDIPGGGQSAIERIMKATPRPILLLSGQLQNGRSVTVDALQAGAAGVLAKPLRWDEASEQALRGRIRSLRGVRARTTAKRRRVSLPRTTAGPTTRQRPVVALAASTGGPAALATVLTAIRGIPAPVLMVQHIDHGLVEGLADWLAKTTGWEVNVATDREILRPGVAVVGPGGRHLTLDAGGRVCLEDAPDGLHRPSADRLFMSLAAQRGARVIAALLTGMGNDGAAGLLAVRRAGGVTIAQDETSSAVFGMAKAAVDIGAVERVIPLDVIGPAIVRAVRVVTSS